MPRSMAWFSTASALSSSLYIKKRLPQPKARMETLAPVRPSMRCGNPPSVAKAKFLSQGRLTLAAPPPARLPRNLRREKSLLMATPRKDLCQREGPGRAASLRAGRTEHSAGAGSASRVFRSETDVGKVAGFVERSQTHLSASKGVVDDRKAR